jgi:hypothetical protein
MAEREKGRRLKGRRFRLCSEGSRFGSGQAGCSGKYPALCLPPSAWVSLSAAQAAL